MHTIGSDIIRTWQFVKYQNIVVKMILLLFSATLNHNNVTSKGCQRCQRHQLGTLGRISQWLQRQGKSLSSWCFSKARLFVAVKQPSTSLNSGRREYDGDRNLADMSYYDDLDRNLADMSYYNDSKRRLFVSKKIGSFLKMVYVNITSTLSLLSRDEVKHSSDKVQEQPLGHACHVNGSITFDIFR